MLLTCACRKDSVLLPQLTDCTPAIAGEIVINQRIRDVNHKLESDPQISASPAKGLFIPGYLLPIYVLLLVAFGWFSGQFWRNNEAHAAPVLTQVAAPAAPQTAAVTPSVAKSASETVSAHDADKPVAPKPVTSKKVIPPLPSDELGPLKYSAHVYATEDDERSITLNGQRYQEGESPAPNLIIEQIQQDVTVFNFNGEIFTLAALEDWPGGKVDKASLTAGAE